MFKQSNKLQNSTMSLKSIFIIFGIISTIAIEASSNQYVFRPSKQQKRGFGIHQEANFHGSKIKRSQIHQHLRRALSPGTIERTAVRNTSEVLPVETEIKRPELYTDEVTEQLNDDDYIRAFDDIGDPEKEFAQVTLSKPNQVVRVLSNIMKDISWSEFVEKVQ